MKCGKTARRSNMDKHSNMARHNNTENPCKSNDGFTLIESLAAWTILLIAVTIFLKCLGMAHSSLGRGTVMRKQYMAALDKQSYNFHGCSDHGIWGVMDR